VEISDEVIRKAWIAFDGQWFSDRASDASMQRMRSALQAAIPLVVEGLVNSSYERCDPEKMGCVRDYTEGHNDLADAILAKVKK